ncbi:hypothetical protein [Pseudomonas sp. C9-3]|uniref:hypothetical protein n=1 Tax=Pseudomonas sp. C9-3 TaxID=3078264 RepID=UPI0028ED0FA7|nr:hypothetical protein [Pseudomonas sp. C9-3]
MFGIMDVYIVREEQMLTETNQERQIFASTGELKSEARKTGYKALIAFTREWILNLPENYGPHLKKLYFEGTLPNELEEGLGRQEPIFICLSAPTIDRDFVVNTFNQYQYDGIPAGFVNDYRMYFDGWVREIDSGIMNRMQFIVESLADDRANWLTRKGADHRPLYLVFYTSIFAGLQQGKPSSEYIGVGLISYVEEVYEEICDLYDGVREADFLRSCLEVLFRGEAAHPDKTYQDPVFVEFMSRFFAKQLPPSLQSLVEDVYQQTPSDVRIGWASGRVIF